MKALTLTQPWASLVAIGAKRIETRSWRTDYRGPLAIHAAKAPDLTGVVVQTPFYQTLKAAGLDPIFLPYGAVLATAELVSVRQIEPVHSITGWKWDTPDGRTIDFPLNRPESDFGDYRDGRYAWLLYNVMRLPAPIPARGALGLWDWSPVPA